MSWKLGGTFQDKIWEGKVVEGVDEVNELTTNLESKKNKWNNEWMNEKVGKFCIQKSNGMEVINER